MGSVPPGSGLEKDSEAKAGLCWVVLFFQVRPIVQISEFVNLV